MATASISQINSASVGVLNNYGQHFVGEASQPQTLTPGNNVSVSVDPFGMMTRVLTKVEITLTNSGTSAETVTVAPFGLATFFSNVKVTRSGVSSNYETPGYAIGSINQKRSYGLNDGNTPATSLYNTSLGLTAPGSTVTVPASGSVVLKDLFFLNMVQNNQTLNGIVPVGSQQRNPTTVSFTSRPAFFGDNPLHHPFIGAAPSGVSASATVSIKAYGIMAPGADVYASVSKTMGFTVPMVPPIAASTRYSLQPLPLTSSLVANSNNRISLPANATIISAFVWYNNGNAFNPGTDISSVRYDIGPSVNPKIMTPDELNLAFIEKHGSSLRNGVYCFEPEHALLTQQYGLYRLEIVPSLVNSGAYLDGACEVLEALTSVVS